MSESMFAQLTSLGNLHRAWERARKGKCRRPEVIDFGFDLERNLMRLQRTLHDDCYRPGAYRQFTIYERKPRAICAAPFPDRVVHHALMNQVEPILERTLAPHTYACRVGRGTHRAIAHYQRGARRYAYVLKLDIASYFPCIDHGILSEQLAAIVPDARVLRLFSHIIASAPVPSYAPLWANADLVDAMQRQHGLPIGNLTSQHMANLYLDPIDQWLQRERPVPVWLRYVDDMLLLADDKAQLWRVLDELRERLEALRLNVHPRKCQLYRVCDGVEVLGYRVFPHRVRMRRDNGYRFRRRLHGLRRAYARGEVDLEDIRGSISAWLGHTGQADAKGLQRAVLGALSFSRGESL